MITWTVPESGNYTISLESEFDNYLYLVDPNSANENVYNVNYNDDANGRNAAITGYYPKGKTYSVFYSKYNPGGDYSNIDITVKFVKN